MPPGKRELIRSIFSSLARMGVDRAPSIKTELKLPRFSYDPRAPYDWPQTSK
jgi:hypothetical protein